MAREQRFPKRRRSTKGAEIWGRDTGGGREVQHEKNMAFLSPV